MKYKPSDKVRIKSLDWYNENKDEYGYVRCVDSLFTPEHSKYCGCEFTISHITEFRIPSYVMESNGHEWTDEMIEGLVKEETKPKDMGEVSDGYHTFNELYEYRMLYNAALFNEFAKQGLYDVHKSRKHSDGEYPFGDSNWFIVMAELPTGQISNHYEMKDWDKFQIPEKLLANKWDEHSPRDVADRLTNFTNPKKEYPKTYEECCKVMGINHTNDLDICEHCDYKTEITYYEDSLLEKIETLYRLIICRDAYWKIAGEKMGLGKPWEPDYNSLKTKHTIEVIENKVVVISTISENHILAFPTEEMRDAFYENFKELIESVKELL
jgi:hypothetical protein